MIIIQYANFTNSSINNNTNITRIYTIIYVMILNLSYQETCSLF